MGGRKDPQRIDVQTEGGRTKTQTTELMGETITQAALKLYIRTVRKRTRPGCQRADYAIHWLNIYSVDSAVCFVDIYSVDSDFSVGGVMRPLNNWASVLHCFVNGGYARKYFET